MNDINQNDSINDVFPNLNAKPAEPPRQENTWERALIERLLSAQVKEQRAARRTKIFFRIIWLSMLALAAFFFFASSSNKESSSPHTALIRLSGVIDAQGDARAEYIIENLNQALKDNNTKGVILLINSPGGSPVQSGIIYDEIMRLRKKYPNKPIYAVVEEMCASGAYYVAAATNQIFVDKASLVGSIGVLMDGFGFVDTLKKLGVERRLLTSGEHKGMLDPFSPKKEEDLAHAKSMLTEIHEQFINAVKQGRKDKLSQNPDLFSGLFWTGSKSIELGLADGFGSVKSVARDVIKEENIVEFGSETDVLERVAKRFGAQAGQGAVQGLKSSLQTSFEGSQIR